LSAAGRDLAEMENTLWSGASVIPAPPERLLKLAAALGLDGPRVPAFSLDDSFFPESFRHSARDTLDLAVAAAGQALASAGLATPVEDGFKTGVVMGSTAGNALHFLADYADMTAGRFVSGQGLADFFTSNPAAALAARLGLAGPALTIGNACCSGADAVGLGGCLVASGRCDRVLAGGADALSLVPYFGFSRLMIYDSRPCRPFDRNRAGLNLGEGAACLVLESPAAAKERGAQPLALLRAYAASSDAHHLTAPHPSALGLRAAIKAALNQAGLAPGDLAFVNVHGTATPDNDRAEVLALSGELPAVPLWAVKGATGHTLGAAGALEAVLTVTALRRGDLPPSPGFAEPDPALGASPAEPGPVRGRAALSTSLGFGGANSVLIFERPT
jgi:3-oxoacyl-[acyl-carrier-protein] synthase-1/3-oxoacyl-[acyl-carrier-protein] synthase II